MIGTGILQYAGEKQLTCKGGFAYGWLHGCFIALDEERGSVYLNVYLGQVSPETEAQAAQLLRDCDKKEYKLQNVIVQSGAARVTLAKWAKMPAYMDEMLPKLAALGLNPHVCAHCGGPLESDEAFYTENGTVWPAHATCARDKVLAAQDQRTDNMPLGLLGALIGALAGGALFAVIFMAGYIHSFVGLANGALSSWLYIKFGGRRGWRHVVTVLAAIVLGLSIGLVGGCSLSWLNGYHAAGHMELSAGDFLKIMWEQYVIYDQTTILSNEYDRLVKDIPEEDRVNLISRDEFIDRYYNPELDADREELRDELMKNWLLGLLYGLGGSFGVLIIAGQGDKRYLVQEL